MSEEFTWLTQQFTERLRFYQSLTSIGLTRPRSIDVDVIEAPARTSEQHIEARTVGLGLSLASSETLTQIRENLGECTRCALHEKRTNIVFGVGSTNADLMFIGEGPGYEEDQKGVPFVGPAGQLLTKIIEAISLNREDVYIANVVKCRPPQNRCPETTEIDACRPFLDRQIDAVRPKVICALGRVAALTVLDTTLGISKVRGKQYHYRGATVVPTYHPAYLLRYPVKKRETWEDMKLIRSLLE